ncbi:MAG: AlkZ family DNA glycosylase [Actinobacteria bacterium]|nr:AlkZ family DNA glycosylase [Actinomycetota bacterium]
MARALTADQLRVLRLTAQHLAGEPAGGIVGAVTRVVGVQAQAAAPARLALRARVTGIGVEDVNRTCAVGEVVRTWAMRGTLHMLAAADVRWMVGLLGPVFARAHQRRREQLGLDEVSCGRGMAGIERVLRGSVPLTRAELVRRLGDEGLALDLRSQAPAHLVGYAAMRGLICRGPEVDADEPTYVLLDEWVAAGPAGDRDGALAELARRYLAGYGPAGVADFVAWSGLPVRDGRRAFTLLADELVEVEVAGTVLCAPRSLELDADPVCPPRLLGHFDSLLLGYRGRDLFVDPVHATRIQAGGGYIRPAAIVGGRVVGSWRLDGGRNLRRVVLEPFGPLPAPDLDGLRRDADDVGRFLGLTLPLPGSPRSR